MATWITFNYPGSAENLRQFKEAMKHGHIRSLMWKLLLYGAAGSGKSSVKEMILGNPPPVNRTSTPLAMRPTTVYRINLDGEEFTTITTLQERRAFLVRALLQSTPNLKHHLRPPKVTSSSDQPVSTVAVSQVQSKDQMSPDQGKPPPLDNQPPSALLQEPASLDHRQSDEDIDTSEVDDILQSISTDQELVKLMGQLSTTVDPLACFRLIQMIDAGGQPQFHEILPVFLHNLSYYVFVFRLCDDLAIHPVVEFYVDGKPVGSPFTSAQSIEQLLQHCVRCIHSHRPPTGSESECPQIMVIGTHVDHEIESSESRDEKNRKILKHLSPLDRKQIMFHDASEKKVFFPVNARFPGDAEDKIVKQVRQGLFCADLVTPVDIPLRWFALEILLGEMAQTLERGVLSREDCITAAIEKLHFEEDAVEAALQYLDQVSAIMYYPKILPNVIFADPQIVLDKISELVFKSVEMEKLSKEQALTGDWIKFHDFALVTIKFLLKEVFNTHYIPGLFEVGDLALLFKKLLIFATYSESEYFVPALLHHLDSQAVDDHRVRCIPSLVLMFPGGGPRQGIFCALLCWLVSPENDSPAPWSISVDDLGSPLCLYRNCVQLDVPDSLSTVTLIDTYTHFEVHGDIPEEFPLLRKAIEKGLHKAALNLGYFDSSPSSALLCPCGRGEAHVAEIVKSTHWKCSLKNVAKKYDKLSSDQQLWLAYTPSTDEKLKLSECDLSKLLCKLNPHASKWREVGTHLGFRQGELDNIEHKPLLLSEGPKAWLREILREWLEWAPGDSRGSSSSASIEYLKCVLDKSGLAQTALEIESCFTR